MKETTRFCVGPDLLVMKIISVETDDGHKETRVYSDHSWFLDGSDDQATAQPPSPLPARVAPQEEFKPTTPTASGVSWSVRPVGHVGPGATIRLQNLTKSTPLAEYNRALRDVLGSSDSISARLRRGAFQFSASFFFFFFFPLFFRRSTCPLSIRRQPRAIELL